ncbi:hypothetical protein N9D71_01025, partial [bacterium]|nr:hypothetical protein [bacterium]
IHLPTPPTRTRVRKLLTGAPPHPLQELLGAKSDERPDFILRNLSELFLDYPELKTTKRGVRCRESEVELLGDKIVCSSQNPKELDSFRAAASLIWSSGRPIYGLQVEQELMG